VSAGQLLTTNHPTTLALSTLQAMRECRINEPVGLSRDSSGSDELSSFVSWFIGFHALRVQYSLTCTDGASCSGCDLPDGTPYYPVDGYRRFGGTYCLHLYDGNMWSEGSVARKEKTLTCGGWSLTRGSEQEDGCLRTQWYFPPRDGAGNARLYGDF
jgi:hypothetical protein